MFTKWVNMGMMFDKTAMKVVPFIFGGVSFPSIKGILSNYRREELANYYASRTPGLDPAMIRIKTVFTPKSREETKGRSNTEMSLAYMTAATVDRYPSCANGNFTCPLMNYLRKCGCGETKVDCRYLFDNKCDPELNCYKYFFDSGNCKVKDCERNAAEKSSLERFLGYRGVGRVQLECEHTIHAYQP